MFELLYDPRHNVLMTRLYGAFVESDIVLRDKAVARFVARRGKARGIMDFSGIEAVEVPIETVVRRATDPALLEGETVIVAPRDPLWALNRIFAAHRLYRFGTEPALVRTLDEAYRALALAQPAFSPLELDPESRLESVAVNVLAGIAQTRAAAAAEQREHTRRTMLRLLDTVMARSEPASEVAAITLSDVLNAALGGVSLRDSDLKMTCAGCNNHQTLSCYTISTGRETTYACPTCRRVAVVLAAARGTAAKATPPGYEMGRFVVRTAGDIECPGALLPKSEP